MRWLCTILCILALLTLATFVSAADNADWPDRYIGFTGATYLQFGNQHIKHLRTDLFYSYSSFGKDAVNIKVSIIDQFGNVSQKEMLWVGIIIYYDVSNFMIGAGNDRRALSDQYVRICLPILKDKQNRYFFFCGQYYYNYLEVQYLFTKIARFNESHIIRQAGPLLFLSLANLNYYGITGMGVLPRDTILLINDLRKDGIMLK